MEFRLAGAHGEVPDALLRIGFEPDYGTLETGQTVDGMISTWQENISMVGPPPESVGNR